MTCRRAEWKRVAACREQYRPVIEAFLTISRHHPRRAETWRGRDDGPIAEPHGRRADRQRSVMPLAERAAASPLHPGRNIPTGAGAAAGVAAAAGAKAKAPAPKRRAASGGPSGATAAQARSVVHETAPNPIAKARGDKRSGRRPRHARRGGWAILGFLVAVVLPTALAGFYWFAIAADRYVSQMRYSLRGGPALERGENTSNPIGTLGIASAGTDGFILEDFLRSHAALAELEAAVNLRAMLARDGADPVRRFDPRMPPEALLDFWNAALDVRYDVLTGVSEVSVALYRAEDAQAVAEMLVTVLRRLVDSLSERQQAEMLAYVDAEFAAAERRLRNSLDAIEAFRRRTLTVSPSDEAALNAATIAQLTASVTELTVRLRTLRETVPNSPQIPRLSEQIASLEAQIATVRARVGGRISAPSRSGPSNGFSGGWSSPGNNRAEGASDAALPDQLTDFERLQNEYQVALDAYVETLGLRTEARAAATLGKVHLAVFVPPQRAAMATGPDRLGETAFVGAVAFLLWVVGRILMASLRTP